MRAGFLDARPSRPKKADPSATPKAPASPPADWRARTPHATRAFLDEACAARWNHGHEIVSSSSSASPSENLLVLLHGRGEQSAAPFARFAERLNLPHTTCLSLLGNRPLPFQVPGREWFANADPETGDELPVSATDSRRAESLSATAAALERLLEYLTDRTKGGWPSENVHLFGFSDGGTVVLEVLRRNGTRPEARASDAAKEETSLLKKIISKKKIKRFGPFGGCVCVSAAFLPETIEAHTSNGASHGEYDSIASPTPFVLTCGRHDPVVPTHRVMQTSRILTPKASYVCEKKKKHVAVDSERETRFLMGFWGTTLALPKTKPEEFGEDVIEVDQEDVRLEKYVA
jgi:predicted esterase